ncbi:lysophospholipid acyltransferase family protein [Solicola gregarius]|uniref:1-acyl-sn-glycerol-3-phosphate acyltransferase n=1 Tax=Solicola gregarius TaxID=2908642 RepID=A0AA46TGZ6_9ACTN|nr:lysophospholipid acyltransferase family protein [Solicola gregarius]UYM05182.1 1-acyl-sn-glycerol-3-phosphate acyltransferase [Solicola gregarius]
MRTLEHAEPPRTGDLRPLPHRAQAVVRKPGRAVITRRWDVHVHHEHRVPRTGRALLACNHIGWLDGPLMVGVAPRTIHALVKHEMFVGQIGLLLRSIGQIPVERGTIDVRAIRLAVRALRDDRVVAMWPEGTRGNGELRKLKRGLAYLALVTGAPVVPVALLGTRAYGESVSDLPPRGRRIDVVYGEPIAVEAVAWPRRRESVEGLTRSLQRELIANLEHALEVSGQRLPGSAADEEAREADMVGLADDPQEDS